MDPDDTGYPTGGRAVVADVHRRVEEVTRVGLVAAEVLRLQETHEAGVLEPLADVVGQASQLVARFGLLGEERSCCFDTGENTVRHCSFLTVGCHA